jgi:hypothetical protein
MKQHQPARARQEPAGTTTATDQVWFTTRRSARIGQVASSYLGTTIAELPVTVEAMERESAEDQE